MKQFTLELDKDAQRPIIHIPEFHNIDAMLDTGFLFPVWCASEEMLKKLGAEKISDYAPFGGFGGLTVGKMYRLPLFQMGGLMYPNMSLICHAGSSLVHPLILPATMFNNLIYEINNKLHRLIVKFVDEGTDLCWLGYSHDEPDAIVCNINVKHDFFKVFGEPTDPVIALLKTLAVARYTTEAVNNKTAMAMMDFFNEYIKKTKV